MIFFFLIKLSTTVHEMAHAIGQLHEQSRGDRDDHVIMKWDNIQGGRDNINMAKDDTHDYNPYDYESVLQYSLTVWGNSDLCYNKCLCSVLSSFSSLLLSSIS